MTTGPTDEESTTAAGGPGGMPLALRLSEGLGPNAQAVARWYCVSREGMATLCVDEEDARANAAHCDQAWRAGGPHRAVVLVEAPRWVRVAERMPASGVVVLACYKNSHGNWRRIRAEWVAEKTQESIDPSILGEYDEATDTYYDPQGWYERIDNWDDGFSAVGVTQGEVTHWMPLPEPPALPDLGPNVISTTR